MAVIAAVVRIQPPLVTVSGLTPTVAAELASFSLAGCWQAVAAVGHMTHFFLYQCCLFQHCKINIRIIGKFSFL